ncbi:MAG TPA: C40 family peptidase [Gemmatimonadales bacterium]|nr:C40 family peptidase [Gemmatimonadales bacterium]
MTGRRLVLVPALLLLGACAANPGPVPDWWATGPADPVREARRAEASRTDAPPEAEPSPLERLVALRERVVQTVREAMGTRYQLGGRGEDGDGFDCSGLIQHAYARIGVALPRRSVDQAREGRAVARDPDRLAPGDILTFAERGRRVTHVGMYVGDGRFIHSASRGVRVSLLSRNDPDGRWWLRRWVGVRRIVE